MQDGVGWCNQRRFSAHYSVLGGILVLVAIGNRWWWDTKLLFSGYGTGSVNVPVTLAPSLVEKRGSPLWPGPRC
jgi:hypothetical protein